MSLVFCIARRRPRPKVVVFRNACSRFREHKQDILSALRTGGEALALEQSDKMVPPVAVVPDRVDA